MPYLMKYILLMINYNGAKLFITNWSLNQKPISNIEIIHDLHLKSLGFHLMTQGFIILMFCLALESQNMVQGKSISFIETGVLVYGCTILLLNLKIFTLIYTKQNIKQQQYTWICFILVQNDEFSDSYDFYRLLKIPSPYRAIILTFNFFLIDLAVERHQEFYYLTNKEQQKIQ
ncbi:hypothetical protein pb186bvf_005363 [Paramecium bursaria]